jgi:hypothetical protein
MNATWFEAIGDVQTNYADGAWKGSVIQLQLGNYETIRAHLRLFATGKAYGDGGGWTLGAAHFEVRIPGTADHQVLSWEIARDLVVVDLIRSGLLGAAPEPTAIISDTPSFRDIPAAVYNGLPEELVALIGGPPGTVTEAVPIDSDGRAVVLNLAGEAPWIPEETFDTVNLEYQQIVPRPFCSTGPYDWVLVTGPIGFQKTVTVTPEGEYEYQSSYHGNLIATPMDVTVEPSVPIGEPFSAVVSGNQNGYQAGAKFRVHAQDHRIAPQDGGAELLHVRLRVASEGKIESQTRSKCLE